MNKYLDGWLTARNSLSINAPGLRRDASRAGPYGPAPDAFLLPPLAPAPSRRLKIAYLDESGSPDRSGQTSHFVLLAAAIDASDWKSKDQAIAKLKHEYGLGDAEVHAGWMARRYVECS